MKTSSSCELTPRVPSPPPCQLPPGPWTSLASSALCLDCLHANPSTTSVDQSAEACPYPTTVRLSGCRWHPTSSKDAAKRRVKSGNFNWFYRQLYYALNNALSSRKRSVSSPGLRWIVMAVVVTLPWTQQRWALPFLCVLATTPEVSEKLGTRHKTVGMRARQMVSLLRRWLPTVPIKLIGDTAYSTRASVLQRPCSPRIKHRLLRRLSLIL